MIGNASSNRGEFYLMMNMYKVIKAPALVCMISGQAAYRLESLSGEQVVARAMAMLRKAFA
jgi:TPP-dependent pyruvate/acetoin dehydrogenase alpha subunit